MRKTKWIIYIYFLLGGIAYAQDTTEIKISKIISQMTLEEKINMIGGYRFATKPLERFGIPKVRMSDGPVGVGNYGKSTAYAASILLAASWNTELAKKIGTSIGKEAKADTVGIMLGPAMNMHRAPMCQRNFEYMGEDPFLAGKIASSYVIGMQEQGVMATIKHFAANNQEYDRNNVSSDMDERTLQEIYLPAFRMCIQEGKAACLMTSYNLINGVHASSNEHLLNEILRTQWGFDGVVMSDWGSTYDGVISANSGLDLEMPRGKHMCLDTLSPAIKNGTLKEEIINEKIRRMLKLFYRFGLMNIKTPNVPKVDKEEMSKVALEEAREGIVLLKNENNFLPLDQNKTKTILVIGPNADPAVVGGGGSSNVEPLKEISVLDGVKKIVGDNSKIIYYPMSDCRPNLKEININQVYCLDENGKEVQGMRGEYFTNINFEGTPKLTRIDKKINYDYEFEKEFPKLNVSIRWTGKIKVKKTGLYKFTISGDDGYRFYLDNKLTVEEWREQREKTSCQIIELKAGEEHDIKLEYYQIKDVLAIRLKFEEYVDTKPKIMEALKTCDAAIVCVGFNRLLEGEDVGAEGFDRTYSLPEDQKQFIQDVYSVNKNVVVVLNAGGNAGIGEWIGNTRALLHAWYPGQEGGNAVAEIIFGKINPSGKLPVSFEKRWEDNATYKSYFDDDKDKRVFYSEGIYLGYRHFDKDKIEPLFPFGFGLSYTNFKYDNCKISNEKIRANEKVEVTVNVTNTGNFDGSEIVQLYVSPKRPLAPRPVKELKAFTKQFIKKGETVQIKLILNKDAFSYFSPSALKWVTDPSKFDLMIGSSSKEIKCTKEIEIINGN